MLNDTYMEYFFFPQPDLHNKFMLYFSLQVDLDFVMHFLKV